MAGRKANRNDPKNVAKRRAARKAKKEEFIQNAADRVEGIDPRTDDTTMATLTQNILDKSAPDRPGTVEVKPVGKPGERVEGGSVTADITDEKALSRAEQKKVDAEGRVTKRRSKTVLNRLDRKSAKEAKSLYTEDEQTPGQVAETNKKIEKFNEP